MTNRPRSNPYLYVVQCDEWITPNMTQERADQLAAELNKPGSDCHGHHVVRLAADVSKEEWEKRREERMLGVQ